jgi:phosphoglycolate phosphatase-like HAD superfamily hydrolase
MPRLPVTQVPVSRRRPSARTSGGASRGATPPVARKAAGPVRGGPIRNVSTAPGVIFDVEGTLVDCAWQNTESWRVVLEDAGQSYAHETLHRYSGMDPDDMLCLLMRGIADEERTRLKEAQGRHYRSHFLPHVAAFPNVRDVFEQLRRAGHRLGIATTSSGDELTRYLELTGVGELIDAIASGDDRTRGKPHPDLFRLALQRLESRKNAAAVGDTPYDAISAGRAGLRAIGTLGGGFPALELQEAGCQCVFGEFPELIKLLAPA